MNKLVKIKDYIKMIVRDIKKQKTNSFIIIMLSMLML